MIEKNTKSNRRKVTVLMAALISSSLLISGAFAQVPVQQTGLNGYPNTGRVAS
jgi:hypothetical protein